MPLDQDHFSEEKSEEKKESALPETAEDMGFLDHLGELRKRIMWGLLGLIAGCAVAGYFINEIMDGILLKPAVASGLKLQNLQVFGKPVLYFKVILVSGIVISFPFLLYQIWKFVEPALFNAERNWARVITFFTSLCFLAGVAFAYYVMVPSMLSFSAAFGSDNIQNQIDINEYWSFITLMMLAAGIIFELPMVSFVLSRFGLLTPRFLRKYRRHSIVAILILAAFITPSPDPFNQLIVAGPIYFLYEISILVSAFSVKKYYNKQD